MIGIIDRNGRWIAHSKNDNGSGVTEPLNIHLAAVSATAAKFTGIWGRPKDGEYSGLIHDVGKYADQMQKRLQNPNQNPGRNHSAAGAICLAYNCQNSLPLALAVWFHHGGLKTYLGSSKKLAETIKDDLTENAIKYTDPDFAQLFNRFLEDFPDFSFEGITQLATKKIATDMFDVRMISSALVDADFIETEAHFSGDAKVLRRYRPEGVPLEVDKALKAVLAEIAKKKTPNKDVASVRKQLFEHCCSAGEQHVGNFTLTAPTGSGKTLSILAFALHHAKENGLRRVVLVMPFLNIIDQTAGQYRQIFCESNGFTHNYILEDHSLSSFRVSESNDLGNNRSHTLRLLAENWDAPIILTSSVNFFESLHASRNSRLRKLHQLAKSVIIFDEAQSLPPEIAALSLATLSRLTDVNGPYGSSVVFTTATQPTFESLSNQIEKYSSSGWHPKSLIPDSIIKQLFQRMSGRVEVFWRDRQPLTLSQLAKEIVANSQKQILCIVNLKRHSQQLALEIKKSDVDCVVYHLSTLMCPSHRIATLKIVEERLINETPVILITTQCIEAGVDISFPFVYRALAPLESIAQAAGRCNRHGGKIGTVVVFKPLDEKGSFPPGYQRGISVLELLLADLRGTGKDPDTINILNSPDFIQQYYKLFFQLGRFDREEGVQRELFEALKAGDFQEVDDRYQMIPGDMVNVLVPYCEESFDALRKTVQAKEFMSGEDIRKWVVNARGSAVGLFRPNGDSFSWQALEPVQFGPTLQYDNHNADWFVLLPGAGAQYEDLIGLKLPDEFVVLC